MVNSEPPAKIGTLLCIPCVLDAMALDLDDVFTSEFPEVETDEEYEKRMEIISAEIEQDQIEEDNRI